MSQEKRIDLHVKRREINRNNTTSNNQSLTSLSLGYFPSTFKGDPKTCQMKVDPQSQKVFATEEVPKTKKTIKLGNIYEENVGTQVQYFEGQEIGGSNKNQVVIYYVKNHFLMIPLEQSFSFKKQLAHVDSEVQEELLNFSNDPEYAQTKLKRRKEANSGVKVIEKHSEKARADLGGGDEEGREEILKDVIRKRNEKRNKEDADFDDAEIFQDNEEDDVVQKGVDFIESDGDSEIEEQGKKEKGEKVKVIGRKGNLNEYGREMLQLHKKSNHRDDFDGSDSDGDDDIGDASDESDNSEEDSDGEKRKEMGSKNSSASKQRKQQATEEFKYSNDLDAEPDFEIGNDQYAQPEITKNLSNSSDLFAATPTNQGKRHRDDDDDVFGEPSDYKRFKGD